MNPRHSKWEGKAGRAQIQAQLGLHRKTLSQHNTTQHNKTQVIKTLVFLIETGNVRAGGLLHIRVETN